MENHDEEDVMSEEDQTASHKMIGDQNILSEEINKIKKESNINLMSERKNVLDNKVTVVDNIFETSSNRDSINKFLEDNPVSEAYGDKVEINKDDYQHTSPKMIITIPVNTSQKRKEENVTVGQDKFNPIDGFIGLEHINEEKHDM